MSSMPIADWPFPIACSNNYSCYSFSLEPFIEALGPNPPWADRAMLRFLAARAPLLPLNPLPILMRAINAVRLRVPIRQPVWRSLRWRSLT